MMRGALGFLLLAVAELSAAESLRRNAIFILGQDKAGESSYFEPALAYHAQNVRPDLDLLVTGARSLQEVREWLIRSHRQGEAPWGRVVLVAHGSPWVGLDVALFSDGTRADRRELERSIDRGEFPSLPSEVFDKQSMLVLESCGIGRRVDLLELYVKLFGGANFDSSSVLASSNWIEYGVTRKAAGTTGNWRSERLFEASVIPKASLGPEEEMRQRTLLAKQLAVRQQGDATTNEETWRTAPIRIELAMTDLAACRSDRAIRKLSGHSAIADRLEDYGLEESDLAWRVERSVGGCSLVAQGTLVVLGQGQLSGQLLP